MRIIGIIAGVTNLMIAGAIAFGGYEPSTFSMVVTYTVLGILMFVTID